MNSMEIAKYGTDAGLRVIQKQQDKVKLQSRDGLHTITVWSDKAGGGCVVKGPTGNNKYSKVSKHHLAMIAKSFDPISTPIPLAPIKPSIKTVKKRKPRVKKVIVKKEAVKTSPKKIAPKKKATTKKAAVKKTATKKTTARAKKAPAKKTTVS
jgi:hypothetical protein